MCPHADVKHPGKNKKTPTKKMYKSMGLYRHYKNNQIYRILFTAIDVESLKPVTIYKGLRRGPPINPDNTWVRETSEFTSKIEVDGKFIKRFKKIT